MAHSSRKDEVQLLDDIYQAAQRRRGAKRAGVPQVGIIFLLGGKLLMDTTPVTEAEGYSVFKIQRPGPFTVLGTAPTDGGRAIRHGIR